MSPVAPGSPRYPSWPPPSWTAGDCGWTGIPSHGGVALVLPVIRTDGSHAALKLQPVNDENVGEPIGLRTWDGNGAVRLLDQDPHSGTMLLERLDAAHPLSTVHNDMAALQILSEL